MVRIVKNTRCYFNVRSKADISQLNLPHGKSTARNVREEIVVHVSSQLRRREIVGGVQTKPDSTSYGCFNETLLIGRTDGTELLLSYFIKVRFNHQLSNALSDAAIG